MSLFHPLSVQRLSTLHLVKTESFNSNHWIWWNRYPQNKHIQKQTHKLMFETLSSHIDFNNVSFPLDKINTFHIHIIRQLNICMYTLNTCKQIFISDGVPLNNTYKSLRLTVFMNPNNWFYIIIPIHNIIK